MRPRRANRAMQRSVSMTVSGRSPWRIVVGWFAVTLLAGCNGPSQPTGNTMNASAQASGDPQETAMLGNSVLNVAEAQGTGGAGPPSAERQGQLAQATAFINRPEQQRDIETAFRARASTHPAFAQQRRSCRSGST